MPEPTQPTPTSAELPALIEPELPPTDKLEENEPTGPLTAASEPLIQAESPHEPEATEPVETGPLKPATEPLTGQYDAADEPPAEKAKVAEPLKPATEPLVQTEVEQAPAPTAPSTPLPAVPVIPLDDTDKPAAEPVVMPKHFIGIYILVAINLIGVIFAAFQPERGAEIWIGIGNFMSLIVAVGLFFRLELARRIAVMMSAALIILTGVIMFSLFAMNSAMHQNVTSTRQRVEAVLNESNGTLSLRQRSDWQKRLGELDAERRAADRAVMIATAYNVGISLVYVAQMVYLTRPGVRDGFRRNS